MDLCLCVYDLRYVSMRLSPNINYYLVLISLSTCCGFLFLAHVVSLCNKVKLVFAMDQSQKFLFCLCFITFFSLRCVFFSPSNPKFILIYCLMNWSIANGTVDINEVSSDNLSKYFDFLENFNKVNIFNRINEPSRRSLSTPSRVSKSIRYLWILVQF